MGVEEKPIPQKTTTGLSEETVTSSTRDEHGEAYPFHCCGGLCNLMLPQENVSMVGVSRPKRGQIGGENASFSALSLPVRRSHCTESVFRYSTICKSSRNSYGCGLNELVGQRIMQLAIIIQEWMICEPVWASAMKRFSVLENVRAEEYR